MEEASAKLRDAGRQTDKLSNEATVLKESLAAEKAARQALEVRACAAEAAAERGAGVSSQKAEAAAAEALQLRTELEACRQQQVRYTGQCPIPGGIFIAAYTPRRAVRCAHRGSVLAALTLGQARGNHV